MAMRIIETQDTEVERITPRRAHLARVAELRAIKPLTPDEIEAIRAQALSAGYNHFYFPRETVMALVNTIDHLTEHEDEWIAQRPPVGTKSTQATVLPDQLKLF